MLRYALGVGAILAAPLSAHEFWIDPLSFRVAPDAPLQAHIRVGDKLKGAAFSYAPPNFKRFDVVVGDTVIAVEGRPGDRPALDMVVGREGLGTVVHVTRDHKLTYADWQTFVKFCTHKDFEWAIARHLERGLSRDKVRERYSRHAKSLVALGAGAGADRVMGLEVEIVAEANPVTDDLAEGFPVRVLYQGAPRANVQLEVFERAPDGTVSIRTTRTSAHGRARVKVKPGHFYLLDSVVMRELPVVAAADPAWESLWASLTFEVPK